MLDLDNHEHVIICLREIFQQGQGAVPPINSGRVDASLPMRMKFTPADEVFGFLWFLDLRGHDTTNARFERLHQAGVVGHMQACEAVQAHTTSGTGCLFELWDGQPDVFLIEPDGVIEIV